MSETCKPNHDFFNALLTLGLIGGLFASYLPQHFRIINKGSSEGFSPWFLLLGATSSAAGMLNMWTMQWGVVKCCQHLSAGSCLESLGGVIQVSIQWFLFNVILVLYLLYYPSHLKYTTTEIDAHGDRSIEQVKINVKSDHWHLSTTLSWVVAIHVAFCTFVTFLLLLTTKPNPTGPYQNYQIMLWARFLGVTSAALAAIQYYPQLIHTYKLKLVGALSIPMMLIQSPGAALMVISIALRPGTDWTSWIMFAVSGIMQAILLIICLCWKARQRRLNIDDFGHPLPPRSDLDSTSPVTRRVPSDVVVEDAVEDAVVGDIHGVPVGAVTRVVDVGSGEVVAEERTPLLGENGGKSGKKSGGGLLGWLGW